ncbi:MAG: glycosyltransferase family 2 protein, partial [Candidatus Omnitrophica bacterium]|nr:glycosyltransferase family 2 protein [Candidatus Omnitrophota bacterium]
FEIIVCDVHSTDNTKEVVMSFLDKLAIKYIKQIKGRKGRAQACNTALGLAEGKIVIFTDDDWLFPKNCLEKHLNIHRAFKKKIVVIGRVFRLSSYLTKKIDEKKIIDGIFEDYISKTARSKDIIEEKKEFSFIFDRRGKVRRGIMRPELAFNPNSSVPLCKIVEVGYFDEKFVEWGQEDTELGFRLYHQAHLDFIYNKDLKIYHLDHGNFGKEMSIRKFKGWVKNINYYFCKLLAYYYRRKNIRKEIKYSIEKIAF